MAGRTAAQKAASARNLVAARKKRKKAGSKKLHVTMREKSPLMKGATNLTGKKYAGKGIRWEKKTPAQKRAHQKVFGK
jgi:hypothetical protein